MGFVSTFDSTTFTAPIQQRLEAFRLFVSITSEALKPPISRF
jgi:hypothetical protein